MSIESYIVDTIEGRKGSFFSKSVFSGLGLLYRSVVALRHFLYDTGVLRSLRADLPVVSVGNLVAGGTGKTPFVRKLVRALEKRPGEVAVLSRGYRSSGKKEPFRISKEVAVTEGGDEPCWLFHNTNAAIWVGKDRAASAKEAFETGSRLIVLEDGFQHRRLRRDVEIVILDAADPFGKGYFLPRGYLRDSPKRLKKADWVVVTHLEKEKDREALLRKIRKYSKSPVVGFSARYNWSEEDTIVGAFCGIAKPDSFYEALQERGLTVVRTLSSEDHRLPLFERLRAFADDCRKMGATALACTEKDYVKIPSSLSTSLPIKVLKMELECVWNQNVWQEMVLSIQTGA